MEEQHVRWAIDYCRGSISGRDLQALKRWLNEDSANKEAFTKYVSLYNKSKSIFFLKQLDKEEAWNTIQAKIERKRRSASFLRIPYVAAGIAAAVIATAVLLAPVIFSGDKQQHPVAIRHKGADYRKAVLVLSNGEQVNLVDGQQQQLAESDGTAIEKDVQNNIVYNSKGLASAKTIFNRIDVPRRGEYSLTLSDGTKIWLNAESSLKFPVQFTGKTREVYLTGEAYFEVKKCSGMPFIVHTAQTAVKVLGTKFNVSSYSNDLLTKTTLVEGKVEVSYRDKKVILNPGFQSSVASDNTGITVNEVNTNLYTSWKTGVLEFENTTLEEIARQLERWYDIDITFEDESLKKSRLTGAIKKYKPFAFSKKIIEKVANVSIISQNEKQVVIKKREQEI